MKKHMKIALIEDNRYHAILFEHSVLEQYPGFEILSFMRGNDFLKVQDKNQFDLICLDYHLPDKNGLELLSIIRSELADIPIIVITGVGSEQTAVEAMKSGATDYITKNSNYISTIPRVIKQAYQKQKLILKNRRLEEKARIAEKFETITMTTSTLNHEINNPLMAILGTVELILDDPGVTDRKIKNKLEMIDTSARRIQDITQKMASLTDAPITQTPAGPMLKIKRRGRRPKGIVV
ncbi:MAG: response regulator [candidate division Zixibacteria bacterium]